MLKNYIYFYLLIFQIFRCESIVVPTRFVELRQVPRFGPRGRIQLWGLRETEIGPRSWRSFGTSLVCEFFWPAVSLAGVMMGLQIRTARSISIAFMMNSRTFFTFKSAKYSWWSRKPFSWKVSRWVLDILNGFTFKKYFCRFFLASLQNSRSRSTACADGLDVDFFFLRPLSLWTYESSP